MRTVAYMTGLSALWLVSAWLASFVFPTTSLPTQFDMKAAVPVLFALLLAAGPYPYIARFEALLKDSRIPSHAFGRLQKVRENRQAMLWALVAYTPVATALTMSLWFFGATDRAFSALAGAIPGIVYGFAKVVAVSNELSEWDTDLARLDAKSRVMAQRKADAAKLAPKKPESANSHRL